MQKPCHTYLLPIGGTATAALAGLLHEAGERVSGVDAVLYPPTSELLAELGIPARLGFDPAGIPADVDRVIIGNAVPRNNVEVQAVLARGMPYTSQAAAFGERFCRGARSIVVAGTHGKTTTTALTAHILIAAGLDPTVMVGGVPVGGRPWRLGHGGWTVVEGDEYNTAFFDRGPKFMHYAPHLFVVHNIEFDHGDIYPDLAAIMAAFRAGTAQLGPSGRLLANRDDPNAREIAQGDSRTIWYGRDPRSDLRCTNWSAGPEGLTAEVVWQGSAFQVSLPQVGAHNLSNLLAAVTAALAAGIAPNAAAAGARSFPGVRRRLEVIGEVEGITVVDDFAHHPTAIALTLDGARQRFPGRRLVVVFEPRSLTAGRALFTDDYIVALTRADVAFLAPVFHRRRLPAEDQLDRIHVAQALSAGDTDAIALDDDTDPLSAILAVTRPGDVVVLMSSGDFGDLPRRLLAALQEGS